MAQRSSSWISARGLRVSIGDQPVLRGIDLEVGAERCLGIVGPNGAGKTTLIRALAGLLRPAGGSVEILGRSAAAESAADLRGLIGVVGHQTYLYPELTAWENLLFYGRLYGVADLDERAAAVLNLVGLDDRRHERAAALSRGMSQRVSLARALLHDPPVLLLDEPDAGLDAQSVTALERMLARSDGTPRRSVVMTTHDLAQALRLCDWIAILHDGRIVDRLATGGIGVAALRERYDAAIGPGQHRASAPLAGHGG